MYLRRTFIAITFFTGLCYAQVGIGTNTPKAILDIESNNSGVLLPRITSVENITSPQEGMIYYDSTNKAFTYYDGIEWHYINFSTQPFAHNRNSGQVKINGYNNDGSGSQKISFKNIGGNPDSEGNFSLDPIILDTDESEDKVTAGELLISSSPTTSWPDNLSSELTNEQLQETVYDFENDTFLENPVFGQVTIWRIILSYKKVSGATGLLFRLYNPNPDSSFDEEKLIHISPEHTKGNLTFNVVTIGDELSIPNESNPNSKGYRFEIGADDPMKEIVIESITRISLQYD